MIAVLIAVFAVGMTTLLVTFKISNTQRELRHGRFDLTAREIDRVIEQGFSLGLSFGGLSALPTALTRRKSADGDVVAIDVIDRSGLIQYSTEPAHIGAIMPSKWQEAIRQQAVLKSASHTNQLWRLWQDEEYVAGTVVTNSFGIEEGYVAVRYSVTNRASTRAQFLGALKATILTTFLVTTLLIFILLSVLMHRFERHTSVAAEALNDPQRLVALRDGWDQPLLRFAIEVRELGLALAKWKNSI